MAFELLSAQVRKYIRDKKWESLRLIQEAAIKKIMTGDDHLILVSRTASGKTEAAFLPIVSKVDFNEPGVQVLYISPLIALINDQFNRVEDLCKELEISVTKWHGEAKQSAKGQLLKNPNGIVLITPESIEAMFINKPFQVRGLFSNLKYVVIDEIHSFVGSDRGVQLKSLLSRLQDLAVQPFCIVGLSATLSDYTEARKFTGNEVKTIVLRDPAAKEIEVEFRYFEGGSPELPLALLKDLYKETRANKALIFPNSRGKAEEVAVKLLKISERTGGHLNYFSHHSSVDKQVREYVEDFAKNNKRQNFSIACTSTLELGIDIGAVDEVVQIDATHSIASLIQRIGRSGRREGAKSQLLLYATDPWNLLQSLACWLLYKEDFIEPPESNDYPYDILLHQALSVTKSKSGIDQAALTTLLKENYAFKNIEIQEIEDIICHLIELDLLEKLGQELIVGVEGERIVNHRDFYSVFKNVSYLKVVNGGNTIGQIPFSPQVREDENIFLAARIWKIKNVDFEANKIEVIKAFDGKSPLFFGDAADVHAKIREKMYNILFTSEEYSWLNDASKEELRRLRSDFYAFEIGNLTDERPILVKETDMVLYTFAGSRLNRTIRFLFEVLDVECHLDDLSSSFKIYSSETDFCKEWQRLLPLIDDVDFYLDNLLYSKPDVISFSKWGQYLPHKYKVRLVKQRYFDFESLSLVKNYIFVSNQKK